MGLCISDVECPALLGKSSEACGFSKRRQGNLELVRLAGPREGEIRFAEEEVSTTGSVDCDDTRFGSTNFRLHVLQMLSRRVLNSP